MINITIFLIVIIKINRTLSNQIYDLIIKRDIDLYINIKRLSFYNLAIFLIKIFKFINYRNLVI